MLPIHCLVILISLSSLTLCQNEGSPQNNQDTIILGTSKNIEIQAYQTKTFTLTINQKVSQNQNLYLVAMSPFNDPFQQPRITVTSDNNFNLLCSEEVNDFIGICEIDSSQLTQNRKFTISLYCDVDCQLYFSAYLSSTYVADIGDSLTLKNTQATPMTQKIMFQISKDEQFTQIMIVCSPVQYESLLEGVSMIANYGKNPTVPSSDKYMVKGQSTSAHRQGIFLSKDQVKPEQKILVSIILPPKIQLSLTSKLVNKNVYQLYLGQPAYDFTTGGQARQYVLDLSQYETQNKTFDETLQIKFVSFSGTPDITVAFDQNFSAQKKLNSWVSDSAFAFQITPQVRKQKGYQGKVYINISSYWSTNFYLQASINRKPFIDLQLQVMEFLHITPKEIKNIIFQDDNYESDLDEDGIVDYKVIVKMLPGELEFSIRNCQSYKQGRSLDCIVQNAQDLKKQDIFKSFDQIKYSVEKLSGVFYDTFIVKFAYNIRQKCPVVTNESLKKQYACKFHMILFQNPEKATKDLTAGVEVEKNTISRWLKEGQYESSTVMKGEVNYYAFSLPSIENIEAIEFFVTVLQGDISLLVSRQLKYPSMTDISKQNDIIFSLFNTVVIKKQELKVGTYYIGVYGYAVTDYNIAVAISRSKSSNKTNDTTVQVTQIRLVRGESSTFSMPVNKVISKFVFTPAKDKEMSIVKVSQVQGNVEYTVADKQNSSKILCDSTVLRQEGEDECLFQSSQYHSYVVTVVGSGSQTQVFTVLYTTQEQCDSYPWNFPYFVKLDKGESECLQFKSADLDDIHISIDMSNYQIITSNLSIIAKFGTKQLKITNQEKVISKSQLIQLCKGKQKQCTFTISITNDGNSEISFLFAIQNAKSQNVLFDGIATKITTDQASMKNGKRFFYYLYGNLYDKDVNIYLTSQTQSRYQIGVKLVSNNQYTRDFTQQLYPKINQNGTNTIITNSSQFSPITIVTMGKEMFGQNAKKNETSIILISVYGIPIQKTDTSTYSFKLQLNQQSSQLLIGDSKIGYIEKDNVFEMEIDLTGYENSSIQVREISDDQCLIAYLVDPNKNNSMKQIYHTMSFNKQQGKRNILFKTNAESCTFQASFKSTQVPIVNVMASTPYSIQVTNSKVKYFLYYHANKQTFYILQMVSSGRSYAYARPLKAQEKVLQTIKSVSLFDFPFQSEINGDIQIQKQFSDFCQNCYYLIAIQGNPDAIAQLTINPQNVPILLKEGALLRDRMDAGDVFNYQVYSTISFNVSITVLYGSVEIIVLDPTGKQVSKTLASISQQIKVDGPKIVTNQNIDYFDDRSRFIVKVRAIQPSSYYINIVKRKGGAKIFEGLPVSFKLEANQPISIEYDNALQTELINVLVEDVKYEANKMANLLNFQVSFDGGNDPLKNISISEGSYNIKIFAKKGTYTLTITSNLSTQISVMVAQNQLMHLSAGRTYMMDKSSIFQIFSPGKSIVIQIYSCSGSVSVKASSSYATLTSENDTDEGIVRMEHANYGGHYVVSAENVKGVYFVQANLDQTGQNQNSSYLISYHLFDTSNGERMPYRVYSLNSEQIRYKYVLGGVQFSMSRVSRRDHTQTEGEITYKLYISNNSAAIEQMTKCALGQVFTSVQTVPISKTGMITFKFEKSKIKQIIGNSQSYLVGGEATISFKAPSSRYLSEANFVYNVAQLNANQQIEFKSESKSSDNIVNILVWIVIPFLAGSALLYLAARFLIRSFSAYPTQLIEQDQEHQAESHDVLSDNSNNPQAPKYEAE